MRDFFTMDEIVSYNICPNIHYMETVLGYDRADFVNLVDKTAGRRNKFLYTIASNSLKEAIYSYLEGQQEGRAHKDLLLVQDAYSNHFYANCEVKDILETDASSSKGVPIFSEGLKAVNTFYETMEDNPFTTLLVNKDYEIEVEGYKIHGHLDGLLERGGMTSSRAKHTLDLFVITKGSFFSQKDFDLYYLANPMVGFGVHLIRNDLGFKESRIIIQPLDFSNRRIIPALEEKHTENFKKLIANTCDNIKNKRYHVFPDKRKCTSCAFAPVCREIL